MKQIDFVLVSKNNRKYLKDVKTILEIATLASGNRQRQESSEERTNY